MGLTIYKTSMGLTNTIIMTSMGLTNTIRRHQWV